MKRYKFATALLLVILPVFITACSLKDIPLIGRLFGGGSGGGDAVPSKPITLNVWGKWEDEAAIQAAVKKYQEKHPNVTINYEDHSLGSIVDYKDQIAQGGAQKAGADVVFVHNSWVPKVASILAPFPEEVLSPTDYSNLYYPVAAKSAVLTDTAGKQAVYAVPLYHEGIVMVYNKKHLEEINQKNPPATWEEFRAVATSLTKKGQSGITRAGAAIGSANNIDFFADIVGLLFAQDGVKFPSGITSSNAQVDLTFYTNFVTKDGVWNRSMEEASRAFAAEKVSIIFVPTWNLLDILKTRPDLKVGVARVPQPPVIQGQVKDPVTYASFWMYGVMNSSANKSTAYDFVKFLGSEEAQLAVFSEAMNKRTYFGAAYANQNLSSQLLENTYLKPLMVDAKYAVSSELTGRSGNDTMTKILAKAINMMLDDPSKVTAEMALKAAKDDLDKIK